MLFLMNDWVMQFDQRAMLEDLLGYNLRDVSFAQVLIMGQGLYAQEPQLHLQQPERARRLASLVMAKQPTLNALLFVAPYAGCDPSDVRVRYCSVGYDLLAQLLSMQEKRRNGAWANQEVWNKLGRKARAG
ncbi:MAG: hypothetical protein ACKOD3_08690 [Phenylobacterium sp.]